MGLACWLRPCPAGWQAVAGWLAPGAVAPYDPAWAWRTPAHTHKTHTWVSRPGSRKPETLRPRPAPLYPIGIIGPGLLSVSLSCIELASSDVRARPALTTWRPCGGGDALACPRPALNPWPALMLARCLGPVCSPQLHHSPSPHPEVRECRRRQRLREEVRHVPVRTNPAHAKFRITNVITNPKVAHIKVLTLLSSRDWVSHSLSRAFVIDENGSSG